MALCRRLKTQDSKGGFFSESGTQDEVVQKFIETFIHNYNIGNCKAENFNVHRFDRVFTIDDWFEKYNPIKNHIDENTSFNGCAFETYDEELEFVQTQNPHNIWTLVNVGNESYIVPGFRWIDRDLYFVTEKPFTDENLREEYLVI